MSGETLVEMAGITKYFAGIPADDGVDLVLRCGEIHAVLGENGAGKTTLMNILSGLYRPDAGTITVRGRRVGLHSPRDALSLGIGMVHQHFELVDILTVSENVVLGHRSSGFVITERRIAGLVARVSKDYGLAVDPCAYIWQLSVGEQQRVEILRLLYRGAQLMILDEPTAVLTPGEADDLYRSLRRMADSGKAIVFITHKLDEVMAVADQITVLRGGRVVGSKPRKETTVTELTRMMIGRDLKSDRSVTRVFTSEPPVLSLAGVSARSDRGLQALQDVDLDLFAGQILGIAGVAGNGQRELAEVMAGMRPPVAGRLRLGATDLTGASPLDMMNAGVRFVPEERLGVGLVPQCDLVDNAVLRDFRKSPYKRGLWIDRKASLTQTESIIERFEIKAPNPWVRVRDLSGGNLQKLLVGRELVARPKVLVAAQPTRGLDIGATDAVRKHLLQLRDEGTAIFLISEDLDEVLMMSDRVGVMFSGRIVAILPSDEASRERVGALMAGRVEGTGVA